MANLDEYLYYLNVKRISVTAKLPTRAYRHDAGLDLFSDLTWSLYPQTGKLYPTGIAIEIPPGYYGLTMDRSSFGIKNIHRFAGVIDSGWRGEIGVYLFNHSNKIKQVFRGDKIAQLIIQKVECWYVREVDELTNTERGEKGWGSSGR